MCRWRPSIHPIVGVLAGGLAVAVMMLLPALLKTKLDVSEMVCSLMLNYIVMYLHQVPDEYIPGRQDQGPDPVV